MIYTDEYVVFDLETTGLSTKTDDIIEIGAIKNLNGEHGRIEKRFRTYVKPTKKISPMATKVHGITNSMLENAPTIETVIVKFLDFIGDLPLVAHNSSFDISFIKRFALQVCNKNVENPVIDTLRIAKKYYPDLANYKLETIKNHFGVPVQSLHNTMDDCIVTSYFYQRVKNDIPKFQNEFYNQVEVKQELSVKSKSNNTDDTPKFSKEELKFFEKIKVILKDCNIDNNAFDITKKGTYFDIIYNNNALFRFKLNGNLRYWLVDIPYNEFDSKIQTDFEYTKSKDHEGNKTRLFIDDFTDLDVFCDLIIDTFNRIDKTSIPSSNKNDILSINVRGKNICLTGDFNFGTREEVQSVLNACGAICKTSVTKKTDFLIVGSKGSEFYKYGNTGLKYEKALEFQKQGIDINILKENELFKTAITV